MITVTAISLVTVLSIAILFLVTWQIKERRFMPFESVLCIGMIVLAIEIISKFLS